MENKIFNQSNPQEVDVKVILYHFLSKWYLFVLGVLLALVIAKVYLRYQENIYTVSSTMQLKSYAGASHTLGGLELFQPTNNITDEIQIIKSFDIISKVIDKLNFDVSYYHEGDVRIVELYKTGPISVVLDSSSFQLAGVPFYITVLGGNKYKIDASFGQASIVDINSNTVEGTARGQHISKVLKFGEPFTMENLRFTVYLKDPYYKQSEGKIFFVVNKHDLLANQYKNKLNISPLNKESSILRLSISGPLVQKNIDFLNMVTDVYIQHGLEEKNAIATNTINFIDEQLGKISDSLKRTEKDIQKFQSKFSYKVSDQGLESAVDKLNNLENQKADMVMKTEYYQYVLDYIHTNKNMKEIVAPSSIGIEDAILSGLVNDLIKLKSERALLTQNTSSKNAYIEDLDKKIKITTATLYENVHNILKVSDIPIKSINKRIAQIESSLSGMPEKDRAWMDIQRKFNLNDHLYNFLLEKRAEAAITKASTKPDHEVVEKATWLNAFQIAPQTSFIYNIAILLGLLVPLALIFAWDFLNDKIRSREDLLKRTTIPVLGVVGHKQITGNLVIAEKPKSGIAEAFRSIRINLSYLLTDAKSKLIVISSSVSGEGKTFFSINLANIIAISDKRTLLIGADLRKPKIYDDFRITNANGLSSYLAKKCGIQDIINKTQIANLDIIASGPIPPNPAELLGSKRMEELIEDLKEWYDYIIIDTPPIGLVADGFYLMKYSDVNIYMVRHKYTRYKMLEKINTLFEEEKVKNMGIVINDLNFSDARYYGYNNTYGYGYYNSYGYYEEEKAKKSIFGKITKKTKV